ncbi:preprotein translocase subunit SecE [Corynebacterium bovis]|uniref:preprotein translocase subunit SecE n=1 Tax=Corynebacterium bovis TaxID=36808 RepID=UPI00244C67D3|nr:preprotein translocase subunit SecE [Corynebacterium bovis]MDH2455716.1 preprotein translocase subunit SecE [Corynebacterium bovis]
MSDENTTAGTTPANGADGAGKDALRPSGKRQVTGSATTARATPRETRTRDTGGDTAGRGPVGFVRGVGSELSKVIWPTGREMVTYTLVVLVFLIVITAICAGVDFGTGKGVEFMFGV